MRARKNRAQDGQAMAKAVFKMLVKKVGKPETWVANCYYLACMAVEKCRVPGQAVYGSWNGPVAPGSYFDRGLPFQRHGWVVLENGEILDPTRWVFEDEEPYVYVGPNDHYDEGANKLREAMRPPPPIWDPSKAQVSLEKESSVIRDFVLKLLKDKRSAFDTFHVDRAQAFWIANAPPHWLEPYTWTIYQWLADQNLQVAVPIDNWQMVERLDSADRRKKK